MKTIFLIFAGMMARCASVHAQDLDSLYNAAVMISSGTKTAGSITGGFSIWGMVGGFLFGSIGFVAFIYGKRTASAKPMLIGIALMVYPYFISDVWAVYAIGIGLTAVLYFWRD